MANEVQWIKVTTNIFDDEKMLFIDSLPENIIKILEGNYDNRKEKNKEDYSDTSKYENMEMRV